MEENLENTKIVLDANIVIAYFSQKDPCHAQALLCSKLLENQLKVLNTLIVSEIATVLLVKTKDKYLASQVVDKFISNKYSKTRMYACDSSLLRSTSAIFKAFNDTKLSFQDCSIIALARKLKAHTIATFDKDLRKAFAHEFAFLPKSI